MYLQKIKALIENKRGPFTLLGENWGGAVALEVAAMLEKTGEKTQVFYIGGLPAELPAQKWPTTSDLNAALLGRVFGETPGVTQTK